MPQSNIGTPRDITMKFTSCVEMAVSGYKVFHFIIRGDEFIELPLDANVRLPSENSYPYKQMVKTLGAEPQDFLLQNGGIDVISAKVDVNQHDKTVKFFFPPNTGIVNGGHTQLALVKTSQRQDVSRSFVMLMVIENNFAPRVLAEIAASRNTASNVKPYSKAEKLGFFAPIKKYLDQDIEKHIIWYENREVPNGMGINALDLIAIINLFNIKRYQSRYTPNGEQPNSSATSKASAFRLWEKLEGQGDNEFWHIYPLINDIISLKEYIESEYHLKKIPRGFNIIKVIDKNDPPKKTVCFGRDIQWNLPKQFLLPLLASFRADIFFDANKNTIGWIENPIKLFDKAAHRLFNRMLKSFKSSWHGEINRGSKDSNFWQLLYTDLNSEINDTAPLYKEYGIPK